MRLFPLAALAAVLTATLASAQSAAPPEAPPVTDAKNYDPQTINALPIGRLARKMLYATASPRQRGELRMPSGPGPHPLAVIWHGGCWSGMGSTANVAELARYLQSNGVAVLTLSYRELGSGGTPAEVPERYALVDPLVNMPRIKRLLVVDGALPDPDPAIIAGLRAQGIKVEVIRVDQDQHFNMLVPGTKDFAAIAPALLDITRGR